MKMPVHGRKWSWTDRSWTDRSNHSGCLTQTKHMLVGFNEKINKFEGFIYETVNLKESIKILFWDFP